MTARGKVRFYGLFVMVIVAIILSTSPGVLVSKVHAMPSLLPLPITTTSGNIPVKTVTTDVERFLVKNLIVGSSTVSTPKSPTGSITDRTPTFLWTRTTAATSYQFQVWKGTTKVYSKTVSSGACGATTCSNTPTNTLTYAAYKWKVRAKVGGVWKPWSAYKAFIVKAPVVTPTPKKPTGSITDTTPTFQWTRITATTSYQFQVRKGTTIVYAKTVSAGVCGSTTCSNTPTTKLAYAAYKWRVRAKVGGVWKPWSAYKAFTVNKPVTGFNSQFNGNATGWVQHPDEYWTNSVTTYDTNGSKNKYVSTSYNQNYTNFTYEARIKVYDSSNTTSFSGLIVRGTPTFNTTNNGWENGYYFEITNQGDYGIFVKQNDIWLPSPTGGWCQTPKLVKYGWNTLKVVANGSNLKFYINGSLVFDGLDSTFSSGRVGIFFYKFTYTQYFSADWATLSLSTASSLEEEPFQTTQGDGSVDPSALYPSP
ncbi:MAG: DUF1080 domain-containing protein [Chloroflexota bacterium]